MARLERLTTALQLVGAALALPAGGAGVYSVYNTYFSSDSACQSLRNSALNTLEKNIPSEAKRALLTDDAARFEANCAATDPTANAIFQAALRDLEQPLARPARRAAAPPQQRQAAVAAAPMTPAEPPARGFATSQVPPHPPAQARAPAQGQGQGQAQAPAGQAPPQASMRMAAQDPSIPASPPPAPAAPATTAAMPTQVAPTNAAPITAAPNAAVPSATAPNRAASPQTTASLSPGLPADLRQSTHGWVAIQTHTKDKVTDVFFSGLSIQGGPPPEPGAVLTALAWRPIWSEPQGPGPNDPTKLKGRLKLGECVRVIATRNGAGRLWAEVDPVACP
jgi:hypothetical protein